MCWNVNQSCQSYRHVSRSSLAARPIGLSLSQVVKLCFNNQNNKIKMSQSSQSSESVVVPLLSTEKSTDYYLKLPPTKNEQQQNWNRKEKYIWFFTLLFGVRQLSYRLNFSPWTFISDTLFFTSYICITQTLNLIQKSTFNRSTFISHTYRTYH